MSNPKMENFTIISAPFNCVRRNPGLRLLVEQFIPVGSSLSRFIALPGLVPGDRLIADFDYTITIDDCSDRTVAPQSELVHYLNLFKHIANTISVIVASDCRVNIGCPGGGNIGYIGTNFDLTRQGQNLETIGGENLSAGPSR
jgi:hypothetical protein